MNRLSNEELSAIRERAEKATAKAVRIPNAGNWLGETYEIGSQEGTMEYYYEHARTDIPKLLAEIKRLRSGLEALDKDISACLAYKLPFELMEISGYINDILYGGDDE